MASEVGPLEEQGMRIGRAIVGALVELADATPASAAAPVANPAVDATGTVSMSATKLPFSDFASQAARDAFVTDAHRIPGPKIADGDYKAWRANDVKENAPRIARMRAIWPVRSRRPRLTASTPK